MSKLWVLKHGLFIRLTSRHCPALAKLNSEYNNMMINILSLLVKWYYFTYSGRRKGICGSKSHGSGMLMSL